MALLSFEGVAKRYRQGRRDVIVLEDGWLEVDPGDFVGVWGTRRSGKSTLLRLAAGIELPDAGVVRFDGRDLARISSRERAHVLRREIGVVTTPFEAGRSWHASRNESVVDHVAVPLISDGRDLAEAGAAAWRLLDELGAAGCAHAGTHELSPGEQTRVELARALIREPRLLLVDEPAVTPSPGERDEIRDLLRQIARRPGLAVMVASEDVGGLRGARRVLSIGDGRLLSSEKPGKVLKFERDSGARRESPAS